MIVYRTIGPLVTISILTYYLIFNDLLNTHIVDLIFTFWHFHRNSAANGKVSFRQSVFWQSGFSAKWFSAKCCATRFCYQKQKTDSFCQSGICYVLLVYILWFQEVIVYKIPLWCHVKVYDGIGFVFF